MRSREGIPRIFYHGACRCHLWSRCACALLHSWSPDRCCEWETWAGGIREEGYRNAELLGMSCRIQSGGEIRFQLCRAALRATWPPSSACPTESFGTRAPIESWTCSSLAAHPQPQSEPLGEALCSLWKASAVVHAPGSLEEHLQRPRLAHQVGFFMQVSHEVHFLLACPGQTLCSHSRIDPRCELALQMQLRTVISPSRSPPCCQVLHPHPHPSSRGMINTCCNKTHQLLIFPPLFAAGSGSHALFSTSRSSEPLQAEK